MIRVKITIDYSKGSKPITTLQFDNDNDLYSNVLLPEEYSKLVSLISKGIPSVDNVFGKSGAIFEYLFTDWNEIYITLYDVYKGFEKCEFKNKLFFRNQNDERKLISEITSFPDVHSLELSIFLDKIYQRVKNEKEKIFNELEKWEKIRFQLEETIKFIDEMIEKTKKQQRKIEKLLKPLKDFKENTMGLIRKAIEFVKSPIKFVKNIFAKKKKEELKKVEKQIEEKEMELKLLQVQRKEIENVYNEVLGEIRKLEKQIKTQKSLLDAYKEKKNQKNDKKRNNGLDLGL